VNAQRREGGGRNLSITLTIGRWPGGVGGLSSRKRRTPATFLSRKPPRERAGLSRKKEKAKLISSHFPPGTRKGDRTSFQEGRRKDGMGEITAT